MGDDYKTGKEQPKKKPRFRRNPDSVMIDEPAPNQSVANGFLARGTADPTSSVVSGTLYDTLTELSYQGEPATVDCTPPNGDWSMTFNLNPVPAQGTPLLLTVYITSNSGGSNGASKVIPLKMEEPVAGFLQIDLGSPNVTGPPANRRVTIDVDAGPGDSKAHVSAVLIKNTKDHVKHGTPRVVKGQGTFTFAKIPVGAYTLTVYSARTRKGSVSTAVTV